ncbi:hypothetical protein E2C01_046728 [Portunus trituberculatus]|uniref:Uncharacterized protein n=1 Tax=Portunus trituberculatus TaxID=210409 RepID=A0A5B7G5L3_PORTR|nr:hypothetical protein [Portunus trituberculatus]
MPQKGGETHVLCHFIRVARYSCHHLYSLFFRPPPLPPPPPPPSPGPYFLSSPLRLLPSFSSPFFASSHAVCRVSTSGVASFHNDIQEAFSIMGWLCFSIVKPGSGGGMRLCKLDQEPEAVRGRAFSSPGDSLRQVKFSRHASSPKH